MTFYHREKPDFFSHHYHFELWGEELSLYLDVDERQIVKSFFYTWKGDARISKQFSDLALLVEGRDLTFIPTSFGMGEGERGDVFPFAFFFYRHFISWITDSGRSLCELRGKSSYGLICRCAGVYEEDILESIKEAVAEGLLSVHEVLRSLGDRLLVGISCGSCLLDLHELINSHGEIKNKRDEKDKDKGKDKEKENFSSQRDKRDLLLPEDIRQFLYEFSSSLQSEEGDRDHVKLSLLGTKPGGVLIGLSGNSFSSEQRARFLEKFLNRFGRDLDVVIKELGS